MQRQIPLTSTTKEGDIAGHDILINVYPSKSEPNSKYPFKLINTPGLELFLELPTFPVMAQHKVKGRRFAVTPTKFYETFDDGSFVELGDVDLSGARAVMEDNGLQVVVVDGVKGYYLELSTGTVSQITDAAFYPARTVTFQDGYFIFERADTGQFFISDLLSVTFDPLKFATAEGQPDNLLAVISDHRELFLFGVDTVEVWFNSGAADFPFERNQGAFIEKGCAAPYTIAKQDETVFFVGSDLLIYRMSGYTPIRVSNEAVEQTLEGADLSDAFAYAYQNRGHLFYVLTIPSINLTWALDISTGSWHQMRSYKFERHYSNNVLFVNQKTLVGDFQNGRIYQMTTGHLLDDGEPIIREFVLPTISNGREHLTIDSLEIDMKTGVGLTDGIWKDPVAQCRVSKDGAENWTNWKEAKLGKKGKTLTRLKYNRFGDGRQFDFHIRISAPVEIDIGGAWVEGR